jgi:catechol 2,3-dioxygenase-like lactoylglutathione lyase family enzyme
MEQLAVVVDDSDPAIDFVVGVLGFELVEDPPSLKNDGRARSGGSCCVPLARRQAS